MELQNILTDKQLEDDGAWVPIDAETSVKVRSISSRKYQEGITRKYGSLSVVIDTVGLAQMSPAAREAMMIDITAELLLLDWKGMKEAGVEIPYSIEAAKDVLTRYSRFHEMVRRFSGGIEHFKTAVRKEEVKNS